MRTRALELADLEGHLGSAIDLSEPQFSLLCKTEILNSVSVNSRQRLSVQALDMCLARARYSTFSL